MENPRQVETNKHAPRTLYPVGGWYDANRTASYEAEMQKGLPLISRVCDLILRHILNPAAYDALIGDLYEAYANRLRRLGKQSADSWYRRQVLASLIHFIGDACRRPVIPRRRKERL